LRGQTFLFGKDCELGIHEHVFGRANRIRARTDIWCFEL
jgi:hypothetical protein